MFKMNNQITQERLKEIISYDPETGIFRQLQYRRGWPAGRITGNVSGSGYLRVRADNVCYQAHRLAWLYMTGSFPSALVDHIDRDKLNNRWTNLREATHAQNNQNRVKSSASTSGHIGVSWSKTEKKWLARIGIDRKKLVLGSYINFEDAVQAYAAAKAKYHTFSPNLPGYESFNSADDDAHDMGGAR